MAAEPSASVQILNTKGDQTLSEWIDFLKNRDVGCTVVPSPGLPEPDLKCTFTDDGLWGFTFDTSTNFTQFGQSSSNVGDSILLGLRSATKTPGFGDVLKKFGVSNEDGKLPDDDGNLDEGDGQVLDHEAIPDDDPTAEGQPVKSSTLVSTIIGKIGQAATVRVDTHKERNAIWFTPGQTLRTDVALTFVPAGDSSSALTSIVEAIHEHFGVSLGSTLDSFKILLQKTSLGVQIISKDGSGKDVITWDVTSTYRLTFRFGVGPLLFWITLEPSGMNFTITQNPDSTETANLLSVTGLNSDSLTPTLGTILSGVEFLRLSAGKDVNDTVYWEVTIGLKWGSFEIYLDYSSLSSTFTGGLILDGFYATDDDKLLPLYEPGHVIMAPKGHVPKHYWDIGDLSEELHQLPSVLPTVIALANVAYQGTSQTLWLSAKLISPPKPQSTTEPQVPAPFTWDELDIHLSKGTDFSCTVATHFTLQTPTADAFGSLGLSMTYSSGDWLLMGYAQDLTGAMLFQFFDPAFRDPLVSVLGKLKIPLLQMVYTYAKEKDKNGKSVGGAATSFAFVGVIQVGELQLRLLYQYASSKAGSKTAAQTTLPGQTDKKRFLPEDAQTQPMEVKALADPNDPTVKNFQTDWTFECDLGASAPPGKTATVGSVVDSIVDGAAGSLPTFVSEIPIPSAEGRSPVMIKVAKFGTGQVLFAFRITIKSFTFTFAQVGSKDPTKTKKVLRFAIDKLPLVDKVPLLGSLPQPFDQLEYLWVNDAGGILESEAAALNKLVLSGQDSLYYRQAVGQSADKPAPGVDKVVIVPGHHFMVIHNQEAIIDHVFAASKPTINKSLSGGGGTQGSGTQAGGAGGGGTGGGGSGNNSVTPMPASPPSKGALQLKAGPLTTSAISLQYKEQGDNKLISVTMDATLAMGPVTFSLLGFGFGIPLQAIKLNDLSGLFGHMTPLIAGLALSFDKPPLLIAGGFEHLTIGSGKDLQDIYLGGIGISFPPYTFVGLGEYAVLNDYKSVFLYAKLDGRKYYPHLGHTEANPSSTCYPRICNHLWRSSWFRIQLIRPLPDNERNHGIPLHQRQVLARCRQRPHENREKDDPNDSAVGLAEARLVLVRGGHDNQSFRCPNCYCCGHVGIQRRWDHRQSLC
jgi:hypothetical protein